MRKLYFSPQKNNNKKNDRLFSLEPCFEFFGNGKYSLFLRQKVSGKMIFTGYWKILVLSFSVMRNMVMEIRYLLITEKFLFWAFRGREIQSFFIQKVDIKVIFTWYFWVFRDIPGPGKYDFSCSGFSTWIFLFLFVCVYFTVCVFMFHAPLHEQS